MRFFGVTLQNHIGKYDDFHHSYEEACQNFSTGCQKLSEGDRIILFQIDLHPRKTITTLKEWVFGAPETVESLSL